MWILTIRSPSGEPRIYHMHPGNNTVGRMSGNDIVILDTSASRYHAKFVYEPSDDSVMVEDLGSTNGTYVNRDRLTTNRRLQNNDVVRIGQHLMELASVDEQSRVNNGARPLNTQQLTRDLLLESLDQHAILLSEVASRLNTILDLDTALREVSSMIKTAMGADRCEVLLAEKFEKLPELGFARSIAQQAIQQRSAVVYQDAQSEASLGSSAYLLQIHAALCVPVISGEEILGLIYVFKNRPRARPFDQRDVQLAVAISHQAALTIQRMLLLERVRRDELVAKVLQRFVPPQEAQRVLNEYTRDGELPGLEEYSLTVLAADICDSTLLAERLGARRFSQLLSYYFQEMTEVVFRYGAMLNKYLGDGLMAVFGMPHQAPNPEERAIQTAQEILAKLELINQATGENVSIGVGVSSGPAMAGYLGTLEYVEFTVIGYPVNIAWGLESLARPNRIFIGYPTYQAIGNKFNFRDLGTLVIKKQSDPIHAFEVLRLQG
jgi:class 3 adenylate cyclase/pSer/pThr/pTyr-binding forkhead associated (FHA) protein